MVHDVNSFFAGPVRATAVGHKRKTSTSGEALAEGLNQEVETHALGNKRVRLGTSVRAPDPAKVQHQIREKLSKQQQAEVLERWRAKQRATM